ncbi:DUF2382 domain-containing protein [Nakamurella endophytica]|uniref:DUF2382 domain-containing protein n=1 Tax=Nakamurella endophytica TaxID=1748367 RepID=UPI0016670119|nr:DUF2382 domain-containing protein [Nakamurella endophytica]
MPQVPADPTGPGVGSGPGAAAGAPPAMTRSEERLRVGTTRVPVERARLVRRVVTETRTVTVEVAHDEVELVREPWDGAAAAPDAPAGGPGWLVLYREEVEVVRRRVPVERVRLDVYPVTEQRQVEAEVRAERIELDGRDVDSAG